MRIHIALANLRERDVEQIGQAQRPTEPSGKAPETIGGGQPACDNVEGTGSLDRDQSGVAGTRTSSLEPAAVGSVGAPRRPKESTELPLRRAPSPLKSGVAGEVRS